MKNENSKFYYLADSGPYDRQTNQLVSRFTQLKTDDTFRLEVGEVFDPTYYQKNMKRFVPIATFHILRIGFVKFQLYLDENNNLHIAKRAITKDDPRNDLYKKISFEDFYKEYGFYGPEAKEFIEKFLVLKENKTIKELREISEKMRTKKGFGPDNKLRESVRRITSEILSKSKQERQLLKNEVVTKLERQYYDWLKSDREDLKSPCKLSDCAYNVIAFLYDKYIFLESELNV